MIYFSLLLSPLVVNRLKGSYWVCVPVAAMLAATVYLCVHTHTSDTEYLGGNVTSAVYEEPWNEKVPCSHIETCTDAKGNSYSCGFEHAFDVDYHPAIYRLTDTNGFVQHISRERYAEISWPESRKDMKRDYYTIDGDKFLKNWDGSRNTAILMTTKHTYQNRIALATDWPEVDASGLFDYSEEAIQGTASSALDWFNGHYGAPLQVRAVILVFDGPLSKGFDQQAYWKNGNKNEFVVCIGTAQGVVAWVHAFSWTEKRDLVSDAASWVKIGEPLDISALAVKIEQELPKRWERKQFGDYDWVLVDPPWWAYIAAVLVSTLGTAGCVLAARHLTNRT